MYWRRRFQDLLKYWRCAAVALDKLNLQAKRNKWSLRLGTQNRANITYFELKQISAGKTPRSTFMWKDGCICNGSAKRQLKESMNTIRIWSGWDRGLSLRCFPKGLKYTKCPWWAHSKCKHKMAHQRGDFECHTYSLLCTETSFNLIVLATKPLQRFVFHPIL
jgi:hypothetical protein